MKISKQPIRRRPVEDGTILAGSFCVVVNYNRNDCIPLRNWKDMKQIGEYHLKEGELCVLVHDVASTHQVVFLKPVSMIDENYYLEIFRSCIFVF